MKLSSTEKMHELIQEYVLVLWKKPICFCEEVEYVLGEQLFSSRVDCEIHLKSCLHP